MKTDYTPRALIAGKQDEINAFYKSHGIETEIVKEPNGYILKAYKNGLHIGGMDQIADAIKFTG